MSQLTKMLGAFRVLDLTDEKGYLCGKILADLGADVVKVEPPGGDSSRDIGPFYKDDPHRERSLHWLAYNANKRGITLDLNCADGRAIFLLLLDSAHFVVESFPAGHLGRMGLDYATLRERKPSIILTSISDFGQTGPRREWQGSDLVTTALSGFLYLCGDPDRRPVRIAVPQAYLHAGAQAAVGTMIAHYHRQLSGRGQHVDVSAQQAILMATMNTVAHWQLNRVITMRAGPSRFGLSAPIEQRCNWACRDGYVHFLVMGGGRAGKVNRALVDWLDSEGMADDFLLSVDWEHFDISLSTQEFHNRVEERLAAFFARHTKDELYRGAIARRIMLYPLLDCWEALDSPQLAARGFWSSIKHPELDATILYPGPFASSSAVCIGGDRPAPRIGEHNLDIYGGELGIAKEQLAALAQAGII